MGLRTEEMHQLVRVAVTRRLQNAHMTFGVDGFNTNGATKVMPVTPFKVMGCLSFWSFTKSSLKGLQLQAHPELTRKWKQPLMNSILAAKASLR